MRILIKHILTNLTYSLPACIATEESTYFLPRTPYLHCFVTEESAYSLTYSLPYLLFTQSLPAPNLLLMYSLPACFVTEESTYSLTYLLLSLPTPYLTYSLSTPYLLLNVLLTCIVLSQRSQRRRRIRKRRTLRSQTPSQRNSLYTSPRTCK